VVPAADCSIFIPHQTYALFDVDPAAGEELS